MQDRLRRTIREFVGRDSDHKSSQISTYLRRVCEVPFGCRLREMLQPVVASRASRFASGTTAAPSLALVSSFCLCLCGCDLLKKADSADAGVAVIATPQGAAAPVATPPSLTTAVPPTTPVAPLGAAKASPATGSPRPVVVAGGKPADGGPAGATEALAADGGKTAPVPTPVFQIPTAIPGFDAGAFKLPPGFPSTIPTAFPTLAPPAK